jgi:hypothetical protein
MKLGKARAPWISIANQRVLVRLCFNHNLGEGETSMTRTAECACGAFKVKVEGEPLAVGACSCTQCQKRTGSVVGVGAYFPEASVQTVSGSFNTFVRPGDAGTKWSIYFCPTCGSSVFWEGPFFPDIRGVAVGCFADPSFPPPQVAVFTQNQHSWVTFPTGAMLHATQPTQTEAIALMAGLSTPRSGAPNR